MTCTLRTPAIPGCNLLLKRLCRFVMRNIVDDGFRAHCHRQPWPRGLPTFHLTRLMPLSSNLRTPAERRRFAFAQSLDRAGPGLC